MNISVNTSTVIYIHAFLFLTSDLSDLAKVLARVLFPGFLWVVVGWGRLGWGGLGWAGLGCMMRGYSGIRLRCKI